MESEYFVANRLAASTSPYLLQHKDNPVDWYPWSDEALDRARREDRPIFLSVGYSACHWCHVMAHESFEDEATAAYLNEHFVNIKVDREERPDVDSIYMTAVQAMTGHGGWPLSVFLTPDLVPFYGGTYWPLDDRMGMPSFQKVLNAVTDAYQNRKSDVLENAEQIRAFLEAASKRAPKRGTLTLEILDQAVTGIGSAFDDEHGGFGNAPKFPQPSVLEFLLRRYRATDDPQIARMIRLTLEKMSAGGMYDQIGGGFHRYSVDSIWLVPHFEKMLYDNGQLARIYLDAARAFQSDHFADVASDIFDYTLREMTSPDGAFYATQDADTEGEEGKFYVWTPEEIRDVVGDDDAALLERAYGVTPEGNFEGQMILSLVSIPSALVEEFGGDEDQIQERLSALRERLLKAREQRIRPGRDEKIIASWNAMMLRAMAEGSRTLGRSDLLEAARANANYLLKHMVKGNRVRHTAKDGEVSDPGFLEDVANLIDALLSLYEATFERRWIEAANRLAWNMIDNFDDPDSGLFFDTPKDHQRLVSRPRDLQDGATPSANAVAASALLKLARMTGDRTFERRAVGMLERLATPMAEQPLGFGRALSVLDAYLGTPREVAIAGAGDSPEVDAFAAVVYRRYEPNAIIGLADPNDEDATALLPFLAERPMRNGHVTAYLCEHFACLPPVTDPASLERQLQEGTGIGWSEF
jgi:uncharacterized protein